MSEGRVHGPRSARRMCRGLMAALVIVGLAGAAMGMAGGCAPAVGSATEGGAANTATPPPTPEPMWLAVVHSNDTWGFLYPCG